MMIVAPLAGAWIEIANDFRHFIQLWSLLSRERGLKCNDCKHRLTRLLSLLSRERGLKSMIISTGPKAVTSLLSRERGLKFITMLVY